jgi:hypothetical protein
VRRKSATAAGLLTLVALATGCGSEAPQAATSMSNNSVSGTCEPQPVNPNWAGHITICRELLTLKITNVGPAVLTFAAPANTEVAVTTAAVDTRSLSSIATGQMDTRMRVLGGPYLPPGATVSVKPALNGNQVFLDIHRELSVERFGVAAAARYAQNKLSSPGDTFVRSAHECGKETVSFWKERQGNGAPQLEDTLLGTLQTGLACKGVVQDVAQQLSQPEPPPATVAAEFKVVAKDVRAALLEDAVKFIRRAAALP